MTSSYKSGLITSCFAMLVVGCSQGSDNSEKKSNGDSSQVTAPAKSETSSSKQDAAAEPKENLPCTEVFLTGTGGGPAPQFGNAQSSVFLRSGHTGNGCNSVRLQFDAGRGTLMNLSRIKAPTRPGFVTPPSLSALFLTHGHSDHTSSVPDILETHWILT